jgi:hypothetical protein
MFEASGQAGAIDGFTAMVFLWFWTGVVLLHGAWRSLHRPDPDPIRPAGPVGLRRGAGAGPTA